MTKENPAAKALGFLNKHSKNILIGLAFLGIVILIASGGLWYYYKVMNKDIVARVGNDVITTTEYASQKTLCTAGQNFAGSKPDQTAVGSTSCDDKALEDLIYLKSLRADAEKYGINVDSKVQSDYQDTVATYKDEATMLAAFQQNLAESKNDILNAFEVRELEDALSDKLIKKVHVVGTFVRDDAWGDTNIDQEKQDALDLVKKYYEEPMKNGTSIADLETIADTLRRENPKYDNESKTLTGINNMLDSLNDGNISEWFNEGNTTDWDAIKKLSKVGDVTPVFVSPDGEAVMWRLVGVNSGTYNSWTDYRNAVVSKSTTYLVSYNVKRAGAYALALLAPLKAFASCSGHNAKMTLEHIYYTGTTTTVGNTNVKDSFSATSDDYTLGCSSSIKSGTNDPISSNLDIGNDSTYLNCGTMWNLTYESKNGTFFPLEYFKRSFITNGSNVRADNHLVDCWNNGTSNCAAYARRFFGAGSSDYYTINNDTNEESDNDGIIVVDENFPPTVSYVTPVADVPFVTASIGGNATIGRLTVKTADTNSGDSNSVKIEYRKTKDASGNVIANPTWVNFGCATSSSPDGVNLSSAITPTDCVAAANDRKANNSGWYHSTAGDQAQDFFAQGTTVSQGSASFSLPAGTYEWAAQAEDDSNTFGPWITGRLFTVKDPSPVLGVTLTATPNSGITTFSSTLLATVTGTATGTIQYQFDCDGNNTWDFTNTSTTNTNSVSCAYPTAGFFTAKVLVTRPFPGTNTATNTALVTATAPPATCTINATPSNGLSPLVVKVTVIPTGNLDPNSYTYNMGNGEAALSGRGTVLYYTYSTAGTYKITVANGSSNVTTCSASATGSDQVTVGDTTSGTGNEVSP